MGLYDVIADDIKRQPTLSSVTVGVVTNIEDPEKLGRVKVRLLNRTNSDYETDYIRVMSPMVGAEWGMFFLPEVGDEVVVAFCDGDISRPYVLGGLYNNDKKQPTQIEEDKNDIRMIKTRSGHSFIFSDKEGEESVKLITSTEISLTLDDKDTIIKLSDKDGKNLLQIDGKNGAISLNSDSSIEIKTGNSTVTLNGSGSGSISIESNGNLTLKGQQVSIEGQSAVNIKASGQVNVEASGPASLKGALVKIN